MSQAKVNSITDQAGTGAPDFPNGLSGGCEFVAQAHYAAGSFAWARTSTSLGSFTANASAPAITVDVTGSEYTVDTTDDDLPTIKITNAKAGIYVVTATFTNDFGAINTQHRRALSDGTDIRGTVGVSVGNDLAAFGRPVLSIIGAFNYATAGTRTFEVYGSATSSSTLIDNAANRELSFTVVRYPL